MSSLRLNSNLDNTYCEGTPIPNGTKVWITQKGRCIAANNVSKIPEHKLRIMMDIIEARHAEIETIVVEKFGEVSYYC